ncbi:MAG: 4-(cytidine 5'-diphospho)-2-C-methyl-D-erythritol kinase [Gammaproteobacteria bacterium]|nr:4-(cytidine 5'-diphospho)-2-C-methyl-D-erythritol kinase [Gammaproteobacteria bacterium]
MRPDLVCLAPAKINLFLHVLGRRGDGYHELQTLFQFIDLADELSFFRRGDSAFTLTCAGFDLPPGQNLALRAAELLRGHCNREVAGFDIALRKQIPVGGGLGGGSSDAATVLLALNRLWGLQWSRSRLAELALELGADVPVFVQGHAAWAEGVGEQLTPVDSPEKWLLIVQPEIAVSTAQVFQSLDLTPRSPKLTIAHFFSNGGFAGNDCERVVRQLYPSVARMLDWLGRFGRAQLSGTGGCGFVMLPDRAQAMDAASRVPAPWRGFVSRTSNVHPMGDSG